jgi:hypothetical protein
MFACCGRPAAASFCDPFAYIVFNYARETIAKICSLGAALATAPISQTGSLRPQSS